MLSRVLLLALVAAVSARQQALQPAFVSKKACSWHTVENRCSGLTSAGVEASKSAGACTDACCDDEDCEVWQWTQTGGCWTGKSACDTATQEHQGSGGRKVQAGDCAREYTQDGYDVEDCGMGTRDSDACKATKCATGYKGTPAGNVICSGGNYEGAFTGCNEDCDNAYTQTGYDIRKCSTGKPKDHGHECAATCAHGYRGSPTGTVICQDSVWTGAFYGCEDCAAPQCVKFRTGCNCVECVAGYHIDDARCVEDEVPGAPCAAGKYGKGGLTPCEFCPAGTYSAAGSSECTACEKGKFADASGTANACEFCAAGTFSFNEGRKECEDCQSGRFAPAAGAQNCQACASGSFSDAGASKCEVCQAGYARTSIGQDDCKICPAGQFSAKAGTRFCSDCPAGSYAATEGSTGCNKCPPGQFALNSGQDACGTCAQNTYAAEEGSTQCTPCPKGTESDPGAGECVPIKFVA